MVLLYSSSAVSNQIPYFIDLNSNAWMVAGQSNFTTSTGLFSRITLDNNTPYIAFKDTTSAGKASVMTLEDGTWQLVGIAGISAGEIDNLDLSMAANGSLFIAYIDKSDSYKISVKSFNGTSWQQVGSVGFSGDTSSYVSIATSSSSQPYVAFTDNNDSYKTKVMAFDGSNWNLLGGVAASVTYSYYPSLVLHNDDTPYVVFRDDNQGSKATVMKFSAGSWSTVGSAGFTTGAANFTVLAKSSDDTFYVAYRDEPQTRKLSVMQFNGTVWQTVGTEGFSPSDANYISMAINNNGIPIVAFQDASMSNRVHAMQFLNGAWSTLGSAGFSNSNAYYLSLAITDSLIPYVVYYDLTNFGRPAVQLFEGSKRISVEVDTYSVGFITAEDVDGDPLSYSIITDPNNDSALFTIDTNSAELRFITLPVNPASRSEPYSLLVQVFDGLANATVKVTININYDEAIIVSSGSGISLLSLLLLSVFFFLNIQKVQSSESAWIPAHFSVGVGRVHSESTTADINQSLQAKGYPPSVTTLNTSRSGYSLWVDWKLHQNLYVETGYLDFGNISGSASNLGSDYQQDFVQALPLSGHGIAAALRPVYFLTPDWSLFGRIGAIHWHGEQTTLQYRIKHSDTEWLFGAGIEYHWTTQWSTAVHWDQVSFSGEQTNMLSISLRFAINTKEI
ncbi:hypothetical protein [Aliivibrio kagoshimensis]|uniref:hypothetical protein n=1 Tax=Aliivibrio kagoshimensis TaxID=2910230 RepID=UPI003D0F8892